MKWQNSLEGAKELIKKELPHSIGALQYCEITRSGYENSAPLKICLEPVSGKVRCMCNERIADLRQCSHEIKAYDGKFVPELWSARWKQRKTVYVSYNTPPSTGLPFLVDIAHGIDTERDDEQFGFPDGVSFDDDEQFGFADGESFDVDLNPDLDNGTDLISGALDLNEEGVQSGLVRTKCSSSNRERFRVMATATDGLIQAAMGNVDFKKYVAIVVKLIEMAASNQECDVKSSDEGFGKTSLELTYASHVGALSTGPR